MGSDSWEELSFHTAIFICEMKRENKKKKFTPRELLSVRFFSFLCFPDKEQYRCGALKRWRLDNFSVLGRFICTETINFVASTVFCTTSKTPSAPQYTFSPCHIKMYIPNVVCDSGLLFLGRKSYPELLRAKSLC